jgi:hypothetical protein
MGYTQLGLAFGVAGIGVGMVFPTVANAVLGSVPPAEAGVASGTNSTIREIGGVIGVAVLAAVLARRGLYSSPNIFVAGFSPAIWVAVGLSVLGVAAAAVAPHRRPIADVPVAQTGVTLATDTS